LPGRSTPASTPAASPSRIALAGPEAGFALAAGADGKLVVAGKVSDTTGGSHFNRYDLGTDRFERP
jgi:hypothetical protein